MAWKFRLVCALCYIMVPHYLCRESKTIGIVSYHSCQQIGNFILPKAMEPGPRSKTKL